MIDWRVRFVCLQLRSQLDLRYLMLANFMISVEAVTEHIRRMLPDASVTVVDKTGTSDHLMVRVVSDGFKGKSLLDRHRMIYQALDGPMKDGRIHALEITAKTTDES